MTRVPLRHLVFCAAVMTAAAIERYPLELRASDEQIVRVPANTAYFEPDAFGARITRQHVERWSNANAKVCWYGFLKNTGSLTATVAVAVPASSESSFALNVAPTIDPKPRSTVRRNAKLTTNATELRFDAILIDEPGYYRFELEGVSRSADVFGVVSELTLRGKAANSAEFNLTPRRNASSVHLWYPVSAGTEVEWFYSEITPETDPIWSYYMACGFQRGYFGIQVNSPTERRVIFSIWDSGGEPVDRRRVAAEDRVQLLAKGPGVVAHGFGNEGTGGHSHLIYNWGNKRTYRFLVHAEPNEKTTVYSAYFHFPEKSAWGLIASFRAPKDGGYLRGLYSFNENFVGQNGQLERRAAFGNQWVRTSSGDWHELIRARPTHDQHGRANRSDYDAGVVDGTFYLSNGGFRKRADEYGSYLTRPSNGEEPQIDLNQLKQLAETSSVP